MESCPGRQYFSHVDTLCVSDWTFRALQFLVRSTFSKEKVLHAKKREALGALLRTAQSNLPAIL